jgi:hypothetical protein
MNQELVDEFDAMRTNVVHKLRQGFYASGRQPLLQYLVYPTFAPVVAYDVSADRRDGRQLIRSQWRYDIDVEKFRNPIEILRWPRPFIATVEVHRLTVAPEKLDELLDELRTIQIPFSPPSTGITLDGTRREVMLHAPYEIRVSWTESSVPEGWDAIDAWATKAGQMFAACTPGEFT